MGRLKHLAQQAKILANYERIGIRAAAKALSSIKGDIRRGPWKNAPRKARAKIISIQPLVRDAMIASHLVAEQAAQQAAQQQSTKQFGIYDKALTAMRRRSLIPWERLNDVYEGEALKALKNAGEDVERKLELAIQEAIAKGMHVDEALDFLNERIDMLGIEPMHDWLLETVFRTQTQMAYSAGSWVGDQDPAIQEILWGYEYSTVGDDRVRENHALLDGTILAKENKLWDTITPICGYNCRCRLLRIFDAEEEVPPKEGGFADEGFGVNFGKILFADDID